MITNVISKLPQLNFTNLHDCKVQMNMPYFAEFKGNKAHFANQLLKSTSYTKKGNTYSFKPPNMVSGHFLNLACCHHFSICLLQIPKWFLSNLLSLIEFHFVGVQTDASLSFPLPRVISVSLS